MRRPDKTALTVLAAICIVVIALAACTPAAPGPAGKGPGEVASSPAPTESKPAPAKGTAETPTVSQSKPALAPLSPRVPVKLAFSGAASDAGYFVALEKGYFEKQGLDVEVVSIATAGEMTVALAAGQVDVASATPGAGYFNAIQRDLPLKVVADKGSVAPGWGFAALVVRKDLWDSGQFKDFPDMKGKTVATAPNSELSELVVVKALEKAKLKLSDIDLKNLGFPDMTTALANKSIDMALQIEPLLAQGLARGVFVRWKGADEVFPNAVLSAMGYGPQFMKNKPEAAKRFMVAYVQGLRDYNLAFEKNIGKAEVLAAMAKWSSVKDLALLEKLVPAGLNPDGYVSAEGIREILEYCRNKGLLKRDIGLDEIVDNQYADFAVQALGKYQK